MSVRTLMVLVLIVGGGVGWRANRARVQRQAVAAVKAAGGFVVYDFEYPNNGTPKPKEPSAPRWLRKAIGDEYFQDVAQVGFSDPVSSGDLAAVESFDHLEAFFIGDSSKLGDGLLHLQRLEHLKIAQLTGPGITDERLADLRSHPSLERIILEKTAVTDQGLISLAGLPQLAGVTIRPATGVTDAGIVSLAKIPRLRALRLMQAPHVTDRAFEHLRDRLPGIEYLGLDQTGITDAGLVHLKEMPRLKNLHLQVTKVTDIGMLNLASSKTLELLEINGTGVTDEGLKTIGSLEGLRSLGLNKTKITDTGLARLVGLQRLTFLSLGINPSITDASADHLSKLTSLETLILTRTKLTDAGLAKLAKLKALKLLDLSNTLVTAEGIAGLKVALPSLRIKGGPSVSKGASPSTP